METTSGDAARLRKLQRSHTGKKGSVTKRIEELHGLMEAGNSSGRYMRLRMEKLTLVFNELQEVCNEMTDLVEIHDVSDLFDDIENIRYNVECCGDLVSEYVELRDDEASLSDFTRTFCLVRSRSSSEESGEPELGESEIHSHDNGPRSGEQTGLSECSRDLPDNDDKTDLSNVILRSGEFLTGLSDSSNARDLLHVDSNKNVIDVIPLCAGSSAVLSNDCASVIPEGGNLYHASPAMPRSLESSAGLSDVACVRDLRADNVHGLVIPPSDMSTTHPEDVGDHGITLDHRSVTYARELYADNVHAPVVPQHNSNTTHLEDVGGGYRSALKASLPGHIPSSPIAVDGCDLALEAQATNPLYVTRGDDISTGSLEVPSMDKSNSMCEYVNTSSTSEVPVSREAISSLRGVLGQVRNFNPDEKRSFKLTSACLFQDLTGELGIFHTEWERSSKVVAIPSFLGVPTKVGKFEPEEEESSKIEPTSSLQGVTEKFGELHTGWEGISKLAATSMFQEVQGQFGKFVKTSSGSSLAFYECIYIS